MLDLNVRALLKGRPGAIYLPSHSGKVREMAIPVAPGDDSHSVDTVGRHLADGIRYLQSLGITTAWTTPVSMRQGKGTVSKCRRQSHEVRYSSDDKIMIYCHTGWFSFNPFRSCIFG